MKETDLFEPIKKYLESLKYDVYQEVKGIDVVGINRHTGNVVLIEMKLVFNVKVILQVLKNKSFYPDADHYIAIPKENINDFTKSDWDKIDLLNYTGKQIGILGVNVPYDKVRAIRGGGITTQNAYSTFHKACTDLHKEKTAGAKTGDTLTERQIIIDRVYKVLTVMPNNKCNVDDLISVFVPVILKHYSSKSSFVSVMRNTASSLFEIKNNEIILKEVF